MSPTHPGGLLGRGILITRPREHAGPLAQRLHAAGADPVLFPSMEIVATGRPDVLDALIDELERFDLAVFVSETAALKGMEAVQRRRAWPAQVRVAAVGTSTAQRLHSLGVAEVVAPAGQADSEALMALPQLQSLRGKQVVIFRGEGGREWLRETLQAGGAAVRYAECYRRARPAAPELGPLLARWQRGGVDAVCLTSAEGLANLNDLLGPTGRGYLRSTPAFVPHPRIAAAAREQGLLDTHVVGAGDDAMVAGLQEFFVKVAG